jgi:HlyD family secretion protein
MNIPGRHGAPTPASAARKGSRMKIIITILAAALPWLIAGCGHDGAAHPSGTFEATAVDISPKLAGQILRVGAREGERVAAGDTLLVVDTELIRLRREEAVAARRAVDPREQGVRESLAQARRALELAEVTLARLSTMAAGGTATAQQLDEARAERDILARKVAAAEHDVAALDAEAQRLDAAVAVLERQLADGVIVAPLDGTVLLRTAEPGEMSAPGAVALRLADLGRLELRFYLDEPDLDLVRLGARLPVVVDSLPDRRFEGTVAWIADEAEFTPKNAQTRDARSLLVYAVKLQVANPDGALAIGMPAEVVLKR